MMYWNGSGHMSGWGWGLMATSMVLVWALLIGVAVMAYRAWTNSAKGAEPAEAPPSAQQILAERFARGEIDETEYRCRIAALNDTGVLTSQTGGRQGE